MDLNNIKRNNLDYLLTDILPTELSDRFTYSYFYEFLLSKSDEIDDMIQCLKETKAKPDGLFKGKEWASMPLKYSIMKDLYTVREISLVQPLAAIEMLLFVELYQKELLNLLNKNSCFSLRFHHKNNNLCYKNKNKDILVKKVKLWDVKSLSRPECFLIYLHISLLLPLRPQRSGLC